MTLHEAIIDLQHARQRLDAHSKFTLCTACSIGFISRYLDQLLRKHLLSQATVGRGLNPLWHLPATWHSIGFFGHRLDQSHQMRPLPCTL